MTVDGVPVWPPYDAVARRSTGVAALTGLPADATVASGRSLAVKIDNYGAARPQWGLDLADAVHRGQRRRREPLHRPVPQRRSPPQLGPVRSARTGDLDLLAAMNRPVFAYSGANPGVRSGSLRGGSGRARRLQRPAQRLLQPLPRPRRARTTSCSTRRARSPRRPPPARHGRSGTIDPTWTPPPSVSHRRRHDVHRADGRRPGRVDVGRGSGQYRRSQDGQPHVAVSGARITAAQRGRARNELRPVAGRRPIPERDHRRLGNRRRAPRRHRHPGDVVAPTPYDDFQFHDAASNELIPLDTGITFLEFERAADARHEAGVNGGRIHSARSSGFSSRGQHSRS